MKSGCNAFESDRPKSMPLSFWNEQDILEYIVRYNLPYASIYGDIARNEKGKLYTTGVERTGCMFCLYGIQNEKNPNRIQKMKQTHPKTHEWMLKPMDDGGLGMKEVLDYIGVKYE